MSNESVIVTPPVVDAIEAFVEKEFQAAEQFAGREVLDDVGVLALYRLAAAIYEAGYEDGERVAMRRNAAARLRPEKP